MNKKKYFDHLKRTVSNISYMIRVSCRYDKMYMVLFVPHILISSVSPFIFILFPKWILDSLMSGVSFIQTLIFIICMFITRIILNLVDSYLQQACSIRLLMIKNQMKIDLLSHTCSLPYAILESPAILDIKGRAEQCVDGQYDVGRISNTISSFISSIFTLLGLITLVSQLSLWIFPLILFIVILNAVAKSRQAAKSYFFRKQFSSIARKLFYIIGLTWDNKYAKEIRTYSLKEWLSKKKQQYLKETSKRSVRIFILSTMTGLLSNSTTAIQQGVVYLYLVYRVFHNTLSIGDFSMYLTGINNFSGSLSTLMNSYVELKDMSLYIQDLRSFMELNPESSPHTAVPIIPSMPHTIEFRNVSFRYPNQLQDAVHNLSFRIKQGEKLSIVGENGAGKTTVIKLLLRLYQPSQGSILLDGVDISKIPFESYTKLFSVVFQDYKALAFSVAENIGYGNIENDKLWASIKKAGLEQKLLTLEQKENTFMSRQYDERGIEFSGGEQQKVAIASALYKDAPIMILDEPTANLSPLAEYELYQQFHSITENKTAIYISHRMSSCRFCDNILVLNHGESIEYGTHNELMKNKKNYYNMFQIQAQYYMDDNLS